MITFHRLKSLKFNHIPNDFANYYYGLELLESFRSLQQCQGIKRLHLTGLAMGREEDESNFGPVLDRILASIPSLTTLGVDIGLMTSFNHVTFPPNISRFDFPYNIMPDQDGEGEVANCELVGMTEIRELKTHSLKETRTYSVSVGSDGTRRQKNDRAFGRWKAFRQRFIKECQKGNFSLSISIRNDNVSSGDLATIFARISDDSH